MRRDHAARIHWSGEHVRYGLPGATRTIDPAWPLDARRLHDEGWSLACEFERPPSVQGDPSLGRVHFLADEAPHEQLHPGAWLQMFERATQQYARVEILD